MNEGNPIPKKAQMNTKSQTLAAPMVYIGTSGYLSCYGFHWMVWFPQPFYEHVIIVMIGVTINIIIVIIIGVIIIIVVIIIVAPC